MRRWGIRRRVTAAFAAAMAIVLAGVGVYLHVELASGLDESVDDNLELRFDSLAQALDEGAAIGNAGDDLAFTDDDGYAQVLGDGGEVVLDSGGAAAPILTEQQHEAASAGPTLLGRVSVPQAEEEVRILAGPAQSRDGKVVAVVGQSLEDRDETLARLDGLLAVGLPATLALASLAGWVALGAALRPVDAMRRRAAALSAADIDRRLPIPEADDELRRLGETLNGMLDRLATAIERERVFVDDASHELRTPLTLHKTELELALRYGTTTAELRAAIASAIEEADRLAQLADDLLVIARSQKGKLALKLERVAVGELLADIATRFDARVAGKRRLHVEPAPEGAAIDADRLRLEQALTNLIDNALRHGDGEVAISAEAGDESFVLHVRDGGPGFPQEFLPRAFERFSRADPARGRGGTGLGLAIVDAIARAHGGRAGAANRAGGGADVWIELPFIGLSSPSGITGPVDGDPWSEDDLDEDRDDGPGERGDGGRLRH